MTVFLNEIFNVNDAHSSIMLMGFNPNTFKTLISPDLQIPKTFLIAESNPRTYVTSGYEEFAWTQRACKEASVCGIWIVKTPSIEDAYWISHMVSSGRLVVGFLDIETIVPSLIIQTLRHHCVPICTSPEEFVIALQTLYTNRRNNV